MKYRDKEIGTPTIEQVVEYCQRMKFQFSPYDCYAHYKAQDFKTNKNLEFKTLESMCNVYNGSYIYKKKSGKVKTDFDTLHYENSPYKEQLLDLRWRLFREFAIVARRGVCENCGSKKNLVIHHPQYKDGYNAWDYSVKDVVCLCNNCHKKIHNIK